MTLASITIWSWEISDRPIDGQLARPDEVRQTTEEAWSIAAHGPHRLLDNAVRFISDRLHADAPCSGLHALHAGDHTG